MVGLIDRIPLFWIYLLFKVDESDVRYDIDFHESYATLFFIVLGEIHEFDSLDVCWEYVKGNASATVRKIHFSKSKWEISTSCNRVHVKVL